jgi:hemerythrin-like metal-binding protein
MDISFLTGCEPVDIQHRQLFDAINALLDACEGGADREALKKSLNFLSDYTVKHFFDEEQILKKYGFSNLAGHHQYHEAFKKTVRDFEHEFILKGISDALVQGVQDKIGKWLIEHIKGQDFQWAKELKGRAPDMFSAVPPPAGCVTRTLAAEPDNPVTRTQPAGEAPAPVTPPKDKASANSENHDPAKKRRAASIQIKITVLPPVLVFVSVVIMAVIGILNMRDLAHTAAVIIIESKLKGDMITFRNILADSFGDLRLENGKLTNSAGTPLDGHYEIIDRIVKDLNISAGVFIRDNSGFRRVLTGSSGKKPEDISIDAANAAREPLLAGRDYTGDLRVQGVHYIGSYEPLFRAPADKTVIGALFVGVEMSTVDRIIAGRSGRLVITIGAAAAALLLFAAAFSFVFVRALVINPLKKITGALEKAADGDIARQIRLRPGDEIGDIAGHFDRTLENLKRLVIIIGNEAGAVDDIGRDLSQNMTRTTGAMDRITSGIGRMQEQINTQSESVAATGAAMEKITENIGQLNGEIETQIESVAWSSSAIEKMLTSIESVTCVSRTNSENVSRLAEASEVGRAGLRAVAEDMQGIARESEGLLEINSVLSSIASQTNLLSMNAAIEAAHAGEAGRGFAVVADEIRKLAESSGKQSKTISTVLKKIKDSITRISAATGAVLDKFGTIEADVKIVSEHEDQIRSAMEEQTSGSKQILEALDKLNEITRMVRSTADQMRAESQEIIGRGQNLNLATAGIADGMSAIADCAAEVNDAVARVNAISVKNGSNIDVLKEAISRFTIADDPPSTGAEKTGERHK